ncbi:MAG: hypothetical protein IJ574_00280 [Bacilli bacterium]|nr:hypothetical protein [Bacilli bacterium]
MEEYNDLKKKIDEYLLRDDVIETENVISAYTLSTSMEAFVSGLRFLRYDLTENLKDKINKNSSLLENIKMNLTKKIDICKLKCNSIHIDAENDSYQLSFSFNYPLEKSSLKTDFLRIVYKDKNSQELYTKEWPLENEFIEKYYLEIFGLFEQIEYYTKLINGVMNFYYNAAANNEIKTELFTIQTSYSSYGKSDFMIYVNKVNDKKNISSNNYYNYGSLNQYIYDNREQLSKKIAINISDLNNMEKNVVNEVRTKCKGKSLAKVLNK